MSIALPVDIDQIKGFLAQDEGEALYQHAQQSCKLGPVLEVGSYCGKSTVYLGAACKGSDNIVYAVDHHRGSEEHQLGEEYHDPDLYDSSVELMDSFKVFRASMRAAGLEETVVPIVASSAVASKGWNTPLGMVFIDGGHSEEAAQTDYRSWVSHIKPGGILAIHDIFPNPADGGQAPYNIWKLAKASGLFEELPMVNTLGLFRRK
ncbi:class I SAM-dependent methyltransferase [Pseudoteredinibacter isoporae]|uniref:Putative O-methyltransferase YrrM n=1 Tax=Pseudoteredinibacter isoporae TaxID=570281 RepID=A0A7X0JRA8_9GAMM|nr:class I SAM-dependent methyltransferase [Pseudoteredinibacter isoporae]MBB6519940.1 putative O-methyltransferase YrrM [Pseudoteredinibacter isoporae]NHO85515.1 class I SAM-dependent methyltransferase [Pseudoteredinibacter isoporae]NIB26033.1 class I SAM-dependent methyltransferase [Pseudoteredinibacter isoporae]